MPKPLAVDLPYPKLDGIIEDYNSARIIMPAYASLHSELGAILQYVYHNFFFSREGFKETAEILESISICEMNHLELLGKTLLRLGCDPVYAVKNLLSLEYFSTSEISYSKTPQKMLLDDISGEMYAVEEYSRMIKKLTNEKVSAIISRIRLDEELHVLALKEQLKKINQTPFL